MYDAKGRLTRAGAEQAIREGGSVIMDGKSYGKIESLPDEAAFAKGDAAREAQARQNLIEQRSAIDRQLASIGASGNAPAPTTAQAGQVGGAQVNPDDSPVSDTNADEAIETISRMRSPDKLNHIISNDERVTVKEAARKRLDAISA